MSNKIQALPENQFAKWQANDYSAAKKKAGIKDDSLDPAYTLSLSGNEGQIDEEKVSSIIDQVQELTNKTLRDVVQQMIEEQGGVYVSISINISVEGAEILGNEGGEDAGQAISEDGYWGVKAVSDRIVDFAKAISGNDPGKLSELKEAIDDGFEMARSMFDGDLPGICDDTYDEIMRKLDEWGSESASPSVDITV